MNLNIDCAMATIDDNHGFDAINRRLYDDRCIVFHFGHDDAVIVSGSPNW